MPEQTDKTKAIVLTSTPVNDRTQFVHLYTEAQGRITCKIPIISRGKRAQQLRTQMAPMTILEVVLEGKSSSEIKQLSESTVLKSPYIMTYSQPDKVSVCFFMAELIAHAIRESEPNPRIWEYVTSSLEILEQLEEDWSNFSLIFTSGLTSLLGFSVDTECYKPGAQFDLIEGIFTDQPIFHPYYLNELSARWFCRLLETSYRTMSELLLTRQERSALLDIQIAFLSQQIPEMGNLKSVEVLKALFD